MADKNVYVAAGGDEYNFPHCHVNRRIDKQINEISTPRESTGFDLLMSNDGYTLTGRWRDDDAGDYDGLTAFARYHNWMEYWKKTGGFGIFVWSSTSGGVPTEERETVMVKVCDFDKDSGDGAVIEYNIKLAIVRSQTS